MDNSLLFRPFSLKSLKTRNRIVMAPMTRQFADGGLITPTSATYYAKRAEGEVGLILSEGTVIDRPASANEPNIPHFYCDHALAGWRQVGEDYVIILRLSHWKPTDFNHQLAKTPQEMESWLNPLADAGVDIFHCSQRRFWQPQFEGSDLNLAGWAKKVSGIPTITVGSVGLTGEFEESLQGKRAEPGSLDELLRRLDRGDFDLVAVGRPLLADPNWAKKIHENRMDELKGFTNVALTSLVLE